MKTRIILLFIIILFFASRLYRISDIPPSVYWDEASIGYNAYSVGIDGKDEWGSFLPLHFRAFGEFKLPIYIYSVVPFVKMFGLNSVAVRLPSVMYSFGLVLVTYFLVRKITKNELVSVFSAFYIVVTPWLFIFSRSGYEATAGLMFYLLGVYFLVKSTENIKWYIAGVVGFIISIYSYNSFRILSPISLFVLSACVFYVHKKILKKALPVMALMLILFAISTIPIVRLYLYDAGGIRLQAVGLTGTGVQKVVQVGYNYLLNFSPSYLFSSGDTNLRSQMPGFGQLYWLSLPLILLGTFSIFRNKKIAYYLLLAGLIMSPLPAVLTKENPHALRSITSIFFYAIISGLGLQLLTEKYSKGKTAITVGVAILFLLFFSVYLVKFFTNYSVLSSKDWQYGYKEIYTHYKSDFLKNREVYISDEYAQPYIFTLFYQQVDPELFRETSVLNSVDKWGQSKISRIGQEYKYDLKDADGKENVIIFASEKEKFIDRIPIGEIKFLDGSTAFFVY